MKAILFALFVTLLMVGCAEESQSVESVGEVEDKPFLPPFPSFNSNESKFEHTEKLAKGGNKVAQFNLGAMYDIGEGVPQDYKEAVKWWTKSAEQGNADAQNALGAMYDNGEGVPQDHKEAVKWYTKSAEQGHAKAQYNLGLRYYFGEGVPKDLVPAYAWLNVAQANGIEQAKKWREKLELNAKELAEKQALLTEIQKRIKATKED